MCVRFSSVCPDGCVCVFIRRLCAASPACSRTVDELLDFELGVTPVCVCVRVCPSVCVCVCRGRTECELGSWRQLAPVNKPTGIPSEGTRERRSAAEKERESKPVANLFHLRTHTHIQTHTETTSL